MSAASGLGREALVDELVEVAGAPGAAVVIEGDAGTGRSWLLDALRRHLESLDALTIVLRGGLGDPWSRTGLGFSRPDGGPMALVPVIEMRAEGRPVVVIVDDVDQVDEASAAAVAGVVGSGRASACFALRSDTALPIAITGLLRTVANRWVQLTPMDEPEVASVGRSVLGAPLSPELAREARRHSRGVPGLLVAALPTWREQGLLEQRRGVWTAVAPLAPVLDPSGVIAALSGEERTLAELLAVTGPLRLERAEAMADEAALVALEQRHLVELVGSGAHEQVRLRSTAVEAVLLDAIDDARRISILRQVIETFDPRSGSGAPGDATETLAFARWSLELGIAIDATAADVAAAEAERVGDLAAATRFAGVAWVEEETFGRARRLVALHQQRGQDSEALAVLERAWQLEDATGTDGEATSRGELVARMVAAHLYCHEDADAALGLAARLLDEIGDEADREAARSATAYVLTMAAQPAMASAVLFGTEVAVAPAHGGDLGTDGPHLHGPPEDALVAFVDLAARTMGGHSLDGWTAPGAEGVAAGYGALVATDACDLFRIVRLVQLAPATAVAERAVGLAEEARRRGATLTEGWAAWLGGYAELYAGRLAAARVLADRAWQAFACLGLDSRLRAVLSLLDLVDALEGRGSQARPSWAGEVPGGTMWLFHAEQVRFEALRRAVTDPVLGREQLREAAESLEERGLRVAGLVARIESLLLADPPRSPGELAGLRAVAREVDATLPAPGEPVFPPGHLERLVAAAEALTTAQWAELADAVDELLESDQALHAWLALGSAMAAAPRGHPARVRMVESARSLADRSELPAVSGSGPDDVAARLTAREREVVALVARGLTNREVGAELGIARRTVDNVLRSVYRKLGTSDRGAVARVVGPASSVGGR